MRSSTRRSTASTSGATRRAIEWFEGLQAPIKQRVPYENAAQSVGFEQADAVQQLLTETIVPATWEVTR